MSPSADMDEPVVIAGEVFTKDLSEFGGIEGRKQLEKKLWVMEDRPPDEHIDSNLCTELRERFGILPVVTHLKTDMIDYSAARLHGFEADLHLKGQEFATLLSILYVGIEAAFFPGALFLLSKWYTRKELGLRTAILYCGNITSNAFGGLLAAGILSNMDGKLGQAGWRWLFFIEGSLTVFVAICAIFILPDFPATTKSLSPLERKLAMLRMAEDVGEVDEKDKDEEHSQWTGLTLAATDWKVWWLAFALLSQTVSLSFNAYFPTLTATLGFKSTTVTLLLTAPPWFFAAFVLFFNARHADVTGERFWHVSGPILLGIVGFVISLSTMNTAARYIALFLEAQSYAGLIVFVTWLSNSFARPPAKRAVALALVNAWSQLGNIAGS
ncbi:MFS general substrate transporter [Hysterangium stoloniferum]|nr:MFS general substrate transporter [Hysterangium stoloniferum]